MKLSVISLTEKGRKISVKIARNLVEHEICRYCFYKHTDEKAEIFTRLSELAERLFTDSDAVVFVCACGIAVRTIAPYVRSKLSDPAVIVIDDCGKFVIPVLSGHIGGANALAKQLADILEAQAVITTATDIGGYFSPDSFAAANNLILSDYNMAKQIAAAVVDGEKIGLESEYECRNIPQDVICGKKQKYGLYIGRSNAVKPFPMTLCLVPKNIVIGIGCKKGVSMNTIEKAVRAALENADIRFERICAAATIDLKSHETGLLDLCQKYFIKLNFYTAEELMKIHGDFTASDFVRGVTGADNVCERAAVKLSGGDIVMPKYVNNGVTVAAAEMPVIIDFDRYLGVTI